jgi:hypothetical protein
MDIQTETFKEQPKLITSPVNLIWASIGLGSLLALADKVAGNVSADHFMSNIVLYGIICIFPYKISQGSNAARYMLAVITALSILVMLGGVAQQLTKVEEFAGVITTAMQVFALYKLFTEPANSSFKRTKSN